MSLLPNTGIECSYRIGPSDADVFVFPTESRIVGLDVQGEKDEAGRTFMYYKITVAIRATIGTVNQLVNQPTTDYVAQAQRILMTPGGQLVLRGTGNPDFDVNDPNQALGSGVQDVVFGPWPVRFKADNYGADQSNQIQWEVSYNIPLCDDAVFAGIMGYGFELAFATSGKHGGNIRKYDAYVKVVGFTPDGISIGDSADLYLEKILPNLMQGFRREYGERRLSLDKTRVSVQVTDTLVGPNYPNAGCVEISASQHVEYKGAGKALAGEEGKWRSVLRARYSVAWDFPMSTAWDAFRRLLAIRMAQPKLVKAKGIFPGPKITSFAFLTGFSMTEPDIFSEKGERLAEFRATWHITTHLSVILRASGLWKPAGDTWEEWAESLIPTAFNARGIALLKHSANEDIIVDLCAGGAAGPLLGSPGQVVQDEGSLKASAGSGFKINAKKDEIENEYPPADSSWYSYDCGVWLGQTDGVVELKPLPVEPLSGSGFSLKSNSDVAMDFSAKGNATSQGDGGSMPADAIPMLRASQPDAGKCRSLFQTRTTPRFRAVLSGEAVRLGYPIAPPALVRYGGQQAVQANEPGYGFLCRRINSLFGVPLYYCHWRLKYLLPDCPTGSIKIPQVPGQGL